MSYYITVTFLPIFIVFVISYVRPIFLSRYLIFVTPTLFFLIAWFLSTSVRKIATVTLFAFFAIVSISLIIQSVAYATPVKEDYKEAVAYLNSSVTPKDIIAVSAPFTVYPIEYSYQGPAKIITIPEWDRYREGGIPVFSLKQLTIMMKEYRGNYDRIFLLLSYDQGYQEDIQTYFETHYERMAAKEFPPNITLRVYKLRYE